MASQDLPNPIRVSLRERFFALFRADDSEQPLNPPKKPTSLIYGVDDNPPLFVRLGVSVQHICLMFVGWLYIVVIVNSIGGTEVQARRI